MKIIGKIKEVERQVEKMLADAESEGKQMLDKLRDEYQAKRNETQVKYRELEKRALEDAENEAARESKQLEDKFKARKAQVLNKLEKERDRIISEIILPILWVLLE